MPPAFLAVLSETGTLVSLDEFHDWYDNEHIPLRMKLASFLTAARFSAADEKKPSWLALYDVDNTATFDDESYTRLRRDRSQREADVVEKLEVLDRRTCEVVWDSGESVRTSSLGVENPTREIVTHELESEGADEGIKRVKELVDGLRKEDGWVRTRLFKCIDVGLGVAEAQTAAPFLVLHGTSCVGGTPGLLSWALEFVNFGTAVDGLAGQVEVRKWQLYRSFARV